MAVSSWTMLMPLLVALLVPSAFAEDACADLKETTVEGGGWKCQRPAVRAVNLQGEVVDDTTAESCSLCRDKCLLNGDCKVWVFCDYETGCDNGYGKIYPKGTCTLKKATDEHALIVDIRNPPAAFAKPNDAPRSYEGWVSGTCLVGCDCCGWCESMSSCPGYCYYCEETKTCTGSPWSLPLQLEKCLSSNCNGDDALGRTDCLTKETCNDEPYQICPGQLWVNVNQPQVEKFAEQNLESQC